MTAARVGIDIGGTFTDVVYGDGSGDRRHLKTLTTPEDITAGIVRGLELTGADVRELRVVLHGTTVALNAFLERRTPPVGLITTQGFRDSLEIMRTNRPVMYDLDQVKPEPLVPRRHRREISARTTATGVELHPVLPAEVEAIADDLLADGMRSVAVCLLHSYASPAHERQVRDVLLARHGAELSVTISSDLTREWREFERTSTTVANAATGPIMQRYLDRLERLFAERDISADLLIMQSSSGAMPAREAARRPAATLMSGPAGGIAGAVAVAEALGGDADLVTLDIGGTSADVAIIDRGQAVHTPQSELERWPILMPTIDIQSIGAGGGSLASVDAHGRLRVGPRSAGAMPGPACYRRGGAHATVTDANLVLGRIDGARFLGGDMPLDAQAAADAIGADVAEAYGMDVRTAAEGVLTVVNSNMSRLLRDVLLQRGYDPRDFTLLAYGGGGPLHACAVASETGIRRVVVPRHPGTFSAFGIYRAELRHDRQAMFLRPVGDVDAAQLEAAYAALETDSWAAGDGGHSRTAELRYAGQEHALAVAADGASEPVQLATRFEAEHRRRYGFARDGLAVEFVKLAVADTAPACEPDGPAIEAAPQASSDPRVREVWDRGTSHSIAVHERDALAAGAALAGPCVVEEPGATTYVASGWGATVDPHGHMVLVPQGGTA